MADKEIVIDVVSEYTDGASAGLNQTGRNAESLSDKLDEIGKKKANPKVNPNIDKKNADSLSDKLDEIEKKKVTPKIGVDGKEAEKTADNLGKKLDDIDKKKVEPKVNADGKEAEKTADNLGKKFDDMDKKKVEPKINADDQASPVVDKTSKKGEELGKKKWEPKINAKDLASKAIDIVERKGKVLTSKIFKATVQAKDLASKAIELAESKGKAFAGKTFTAAVKVDDFATNQLKKIPGVLSRIKNSLFSLKTLAGGIATGFAAKKLIADPVALADEFETYQIGFETMLKSKKKATKFMSDAKTFASVTPFDTSAVVKNAQRMLAYGFNYKDIIPDLTRIGNASSALGAGEDGITRIAMALGQMKTSGKLNAGDMHQLTEVGINAWQYLADAEGKSIAQVREMSQKGEMSGKKAVDTILNGLKEFDGMMDKTSNSTVSGLMSNIQDVFDINIVSKWGKGLQKGATKGLGAFADYLDKSDAKLKEAGTSLEKLGEQASTTVFAELEKAGNKISDVITMPKFQNASIGGKISIAWDELIATPFSNWWESKGKPGIIKKISGAGKDIAKAAGNWFKDSLKDLLPGGDKAGIEDYLAGYLALSGGLKLFKGGKNLIDFLTGGKTGGLGGDGNPLSGSLGTVNVSAAVVNVNGGIGSGTNESPIGSGNGNSREIWVPNKEIWVPNKDSSDKKWVPHKVEMPKGEPTAPKTTTPKGPTREPGGFLGLGGKNITLKNGKTVEATGMKAFLGNLAVKLGSGAETATGASVVGGSSVLGGILGLAGIGSAAGNFLNAASTKDKAVKKKENYRGGTKLGLVGGGAATGAAIGSFFGGIGAIPGALIGSGVGGIISLTKGNKIGDHIRKNMDKLEKEQKKNLKAWNVSSDQMKDINKKQEKYLGDNYLKDQKEALKNKNSSTAKAQKYYSYSKDDVKKIRDTYTPKHAKESFKKEDDLKKQIQVKYEKDQKDHKTKPNPSEMTSTMAHTSGGKGKTELKVGPNKEYDQLFKSIEEAAKRSRSNSTSTKDNKKQKNVLGKFGSNPFDITGNRSLTGRQKTQVVDNKTVKTAVKSKKEPGATVGPNKEYDQLTKSLMKAYSENGKNTKETESSTKKVKSYSATTASTQGKVSGLGSTSGGTSGKVAGLGSNSTTAGGNLSSMGAMGLAAGGNLQSAGSSALSLAGALASAAQTIASAAQTAQAQASAIANIKAGNIGNSGGSSGSKKGGKTTTSKPTVKTALPAGGKFVHNAKGGYIGNHVVSELGEEGPEMVIPLSNHKGRAVSLWNQAGNILGVTRKAKGGIVGSGTVPAPIAKKSGRNTTNASRGTGQTVVNVGGITISVNAGNSSGNNGSVDIAKALKEQKNEIADTIMQAIADAVGSTVSNRTAEAM